MVRHAKQLHSCAGGSGMTEHRKEQQLRRQRPSCLQRLMVACASDRCLQRCVEQRGCFEVQVELQG